MVVVIWGIVCLIVTMNLGVHVQALVGSPNWVSSKVCLHQVSQSFPDSLWRKLTSSVPRRELALNQVSVTFLPPGINLLLGESSSGKSTILRLIMGSEEPTSGSVEILPCRNSSMWSPRPVYLDSRPSYNQNAKVLDIWNRASSRARNHQRREHLDRENDCVYQLSTIFDVPLETKVSDLTTSKVYLCRLGEACLESMLTNAPDHRRHPPPKAAVADFQFPWPAPILLLDEWLDTEPSSVVQNVQSVLERLAGSGAVVICVTHKPQLWAKSETFHYVTLSRGKVVSSTSTIG